MATRDDRAPAGYGATPAPRPSASAPSRGLRLAALASFATFVAALGVAGVAGRDPFLGGLLAGSLGSSPQGSRSRGVTPPACLGGGDSTASLKPGVGLPVVVVGMPKAGTTSLAA